MSTTKEPFLDKGDKKLLSRVFSVIFIALVGVVGSVWFFLSADRAVARNESWRLYTTPNLWIILVCFVALTCIIVGVVLARRSKEVTGVSLAVLGTLGAFIYCAANQNHFLWEVAWHMLVIIGLILIWLGLLFYVALSISWVTE